MSMGSMSNRSTMEKVLRQRTHRIQVPTFGTNPPIDKYPGYGGGKGGYVCFACGRSTEPGEPFVCVSRLL